MKATRWYGIKDIRIEDIPEPTPKEDEVKVKVHWCGICGSDLHEYLAGPIFIPVEKEHPVTKEKAPVVLGHEFSGEVVDIGSKVTKFKVGDRVVVEPIVACGECENCVVGKYNLCVTLGFHGLAGGGGGFAEYTTFPEKFIHKLPDNLSYEEGALVEPIAVALHAVRLSKIKAGDSAVVFGCGPIGLGMIQSLKAAGAKEVYAVEVAKTRKEKAIKFGATKVLDPTQVDVPQEIKKLTGKGGVDVAFDAAGVQATLISALNSVRAGGQVVVTSIWEKEAGINPNLFVIPEREIVGTIAYRDIFPAVIQLLSDKRISTDGWITKKISLDELVQGGFEELINNKDTHVKIMATPIK